MLRKHALSGTKRGSAFTSSHLLLLRLLKRTAGFPIYYRFTAISEK